MGLEARSNKHPCRLLTIFEAIPGTWVNFKCSAYESGLIASRKMRISHELDELAMFFSTNKNCFSVSNYKMKTKIFRMQSLDSLFCLADTHRSPSLAVLMRTLFSFFWSLRSMTLDSWVSVNASLYMYFMFHFSHFVLFFSFQTVFFFWWWMLEINEKQFHNFSAFSKREKINCREGKLRELCQVDSRKVSIITVGCRK